MDTHKDLSYFRLRLQELLNTSFPEKANDQKFIEERSLWVPMPTRMLFVREILLSNATK
ncbi:DUF1896 family protein [Flavobacterium marginilacus]|uniref:DUF1896 family protein n=1 Tax=Flavobacterium marginilacus TaxID=3003256 RepID=UPI003D794D8F